MRRLAVIRFSKAAYSFSLAGRLAEKSLERSHSLWLPFRFGSSSSPARLGSPLSARSSPPPKPCAESDARSAARPDARPPGLTIFFSILSFASSAFACSSRCTSSRTSWSERWYSRSNSALRSRSERGSNLNLTSGWPAASASPSSARASSSSLHTS